MSEEQKPAALTPGCAAMDRMRARFDAHYGDLAGVMRAALAWRSKWADYQRPYNAQMERPVMEADVDEAECRLSEAVQARVDAAVAAERERCAKLCEDIGDGYQAREAYKWAELRSDAQTGAHDCAAAIRQAGEKT